MFRVLIVHPEGETRSRLEASVRAVAAPPFGIETAASPAEAVRRLRDFDAGLVLLPIQGDQQAVVHAAKDMAAPGRRLVGLYNPLVLRADWSAVREWTRAGIHDFLPVPASDADLAAVLATASRAADATAAPEGTVVTFFSQQGGVGTTTLAVNTAVWLASRRKLGTVVLCDAALPYGSVSASLGLNPPRGLADYAADSGGASALPACLVLHEEWGLYVLAAPRDPVQGLRVAPEAVTRALVDLRRRFDWVIVDTAPTLDLVSLAAIEAADRLMVVTEAVTPTVIGTGTLLRLLTEARLGGDRIRLIVNRAAGTDTNLNDRAVADQLGRPPDHVVPYDRAFAAAINRGRPMLASRPSSAVQAALIDIAESVSQRDGARP